MNTWIWIGIAAVAVGLFVVSCQRSPIQKGAEVVSDLPFVRILTGTQSGAACDGLVVCRDRASFQELWNRHTSRQLPPPPLPDVDFDQHFVVCAFAGDRPSGGYQISIDSIRPAGDGVLVVASEEMPGQDMLQTAVVTSPFDMVAVPPFEGPAELEWTNASTPR